MVICLSYLFIRGLYIVYFILSLYIYFTFFFYNSTQFFFDLSEQPNATNIASSNTFFKPF